MKKLLALVLALVMSLSLVTISNADFKDADKIDYNEAVDVMVAVGVLKGYDNGNFGAKDTLTREQAAKIIAYLELGDKAADALVGGKTFTDVTASRWSAGFIGYCAQAGIVAGVGNGQFNPTGELTALQFGKMLLVELGYDAKAAGMVGDDWTVATSKLMAKADLMDGIAGSVNQVLTREKAAKMCLNALEAPTVEYDTKGSSISVNGAEINFGASEPTYVTNTIAKEQTISNEKLSNSNAYLIELGEKLYKDLKKNDVSDDFGRPATKWTWKSEKVGTYTDTPDLTYSKKVEAGDIYKDLNLSDKIETKDVKIYVDGDSTLTSNKPAITKGSNSKVGESDNGVLTEVYYDDVDNSVIITQINTYIGSVAKTVKATDKKDAYIVLTAEGPVPTSGFNKDFETNEKFEDDAYVLYTYSLTAKEVKSVKVAEKISGTVTVAENSATNNFDKKALTIDGTRYAASCKIGGYNLSDVSVKKDYTIYTDSFGYMIYVEEVEEIGDYALIVNIGNADSWYNGNRAQLVFTNGTKKVVTTDKDYSAKGMKKNDIVTFKVDANGEYALKALPTEKTAFDPDLAGAFDLKNDRAGILGLAKGTKTANSATQFVVRDPADADNWTAYTGIKNAPTIAGSTVAGKGVDVAYYCKTGNMVTVMFVLTEAGVIVEDNSTNALFIAGPSASNLKHDPDGSYFVFNAVVNNELKEVKVADDVRINGNKTESSAWVKLNINGLYAGYSSDKGIITNLRTYGAFTGTYSDTNKEVLTATGIDKTNKDYTILVGYNKAANGKVSYDYTLTVADDANIYYVDTDDKISVSSYKEIAPDANDGVYAVIGDYVVKTLVIYEKDGDDTKTETYSGTAADVTVSVSNNTKRAAITVSAKRQDFVPASATLTIEANVYVDGVFDGSFTVSGGDAITISPNENSTTVGYAFVPTLDGGENVTVKITKVTTDKVVVRYVDKNDKVLDKSAFDTTGTPAKTDFEVAVGTSKSFKYLLKTNDSSTSVTGTATNLNDKGVVTSVGTDTKNANAQATITGNVLGTSAVTVKLDKALSDLVNTYSITANSDLTTKTLGQLAGVNTTNDKALKLVITPVTGINKHENKNLNVKLDGSASENFGFAVTINGQTKIVKDNVGGTNFLFKDITSDIELTTDNVTIVPVEKLAVVAASWDAGKVTLTFNRALENAANEAVTDTNYTIGTVTAANCEYKLSNGGRTVTITTDGAEKWAVNDTIKLAVTLVDDVYGDNKADNSVTYTLIADGKISTDGAATGALPQA